jgi:hypothetical protein
MSALLRTQRLLLRQFTMADLEHLVELDSSPRSCVPSTAAEQPPRTDCRSR